MNTNTTSTKTSTTHATARRTARLLAGAFFATTAITSASALLSETSAQAIPIVCPGPLCLTPTIPTFDPGLIDLLSPLLPTKNIKVTINDSRSNLVLGDNPVYTITVRNFWTSAANGVSVLNNMPAGLSGLVWSCSPGVGSSCGAPNGSGSINQIVNLGPQSYVAFTTSSLVSSTGPSISNSVTVIPPAAFGDNNAADNSAIDLDTVTPPATTTTAPTPTTTVPPTPTTIVAPTPAPTTTAAPVTLPPPVIVNPTTTTVAPAPTTTQAPTPTQPQTIVVIVKQEGPTATVAPAKKAGAKKAVAKKAVAKKKIAKKKIVTKKK